MNKTIILSRLLPALLAWPAALLAQPANDLCGNAENILVPPAGGTTTVTGTTTDSTFDGAPFCGTTNTTGGVWYTVTHEGGLILSTCNQANYDTKISVFKDGCGTLTCVGGQDDNIAECGFDFTTKLGVPADGSEYHVLVHGFSSATGDFDLSVTSVAPLGNDDAVNAMPVAFGDTTIDNSFATAEPDEPSPGAGTDGLNSCNSQDGWCDFETAVQNSVWYSFEGPPLGCVSMAANGFDSQLAIWDAADPADFSTYSEVAANDDSAGQVIPNPTTFAAGITPVCVDPNRTYHVQVDGFRGLSGPGTLTLNAEVCDCDADGVPDDIDVCLGSDLSDSVAIQDCDSGVDNQFFEYGCSINDLINECDDPKNHGDFVSCVSGVTNDLKKDKDISGKDKGAIQRCAAKSDIP
jgi:hypothetical protein